ncbi:MAG TPA: long-chain fatty acid--CoA ligase [Egibacteraceae bacterium]|nr:long-chain fatty acid--CoA ligase [Egibacteraceae bacterium]
MREYTAPGEKTLPENAHLVQPLLEHARKTPNKPLLAYRQGDRFVDVSAKEFADTVERYARGLIGLGVQAGDRVAIMSPTRIEWIYLDYAILSCGAVTVPIYDTSSAEQVEWIISDSGAVAAFFADDDLKAVYDEVADALPNCKHIFVVDKGLDDLEQAGADVAVDEVAKRIDGISLDDTATIIYTSGTTGRPKGCVLTHRNLRWDIFQAKDVLQNVMGGDDKQLLFLPLAHSFAKILVLASIEQGVQIGFSTGPQNVVEEMPMFKPTYIAAVPRIFEKVFNGAQQKAHAAGKGSIFDKAADTAIAWSEANEKGSVGLGLKIRHALFDKLVYGKIRDLFGGQLVAASSGGGPLGARLTHFFNGVGLKVYEGYGLTETSPILTTNHPGAWRIGSVGKPLPGTTIRIADDGEILAKGGQIFPGYYKNEQATKEAIDDDGWFHTGDIGELDSEGYLKITGRKKELIVTAAGKNVAPAVLEDRLRSHVLISQAIVVGDNRPFIGALITIDEEQFPTWAENNGKAGHKVADLIDDPDLVAEINKAVEHANKAVSRAESIRKYEILPTDFTIEGGELTPTLKVKRNVVHDRYQEKIEELYA